MKRVNWFCALGVCGWGQVVAASLATGAVAEPWQIKKTGTLDIYTMETTPFVFRGKPILMENIRENNAVFRHPTLPMGRMYLCFRNLKTREPEVPSCCFDAYLASCFTANGRVYVTGGIKEASDSIYLWESEDLLDWTRPRKIIQGPGWKIYNTSVCKAGDRHVMVFERGGKDVGKPFTMFFAESKDLKDWRVVDGAEFGRAFYTGAPLLRWFDGWFYFFYLEEAKNPAPNCQFPYKIYYRTRVARSKNLKDWTISPHVVLAPGDHDHLIDVQAKFSEDEKRLIRLAPDANASDLDFFEYGGRLRCFYAWGDQDRHCYLAGGEVATTEREFCESFFTAPTAEPIRHRPAPNAGQRWRLADGNEIIGIVHWGVNTFTDLEWGSGGEDPKIVNPTDFNADQIVQACKEGGISTLTIVAKHHDGFCLWPTKTTHHNISNTPFRGGKGDYVKEMSDACRKAGVRFGVYCSPWDRNNAAYGKPAYLDVFYRQVRELTGGAYGEISIMWFDGANGGYGWFGGARERRIVSRDYYHFDRLVAELRARWPEITIFGGFLGCDFRDPGNEMGSLGSDARATVPFSWEDDYQQYRVFGKPDGKCFRPHQALFPLRPGWFFHEKERGKIRHGAYLMKLYLDTVGNACSMEIGIAPDKRGRLDDEDVTALRNFSLIRKAFFANEVTEAGKPFNVIVMKEDLSKGEQVDGWEFRADGKALLSGLAIGSKRIRTFAKPVTAQKTELVITKQGPELQPVSCRRYFVDPALLKEVLEATAECGETDTAKWMKAGATL